MPMEQTYKILNSNGNLSKPSAEQLKYNELSHIAMYRIRNVGFCLCHLR